MDTTLTEEQQQRVIKLVEDTLIARSKNGTLESETDFLSGAMAAIIGVDHAELSGDRKLPKHIPIMWILWPMSGRSVVESILAREEEE